MPGTDTHPRFARLRNRPTLALAAAGLVALGGGAGAVAMKATRPTVAMVPATPVAIRSLASSGIVTVKGRVAEIYGNKFIMADPSGRALIDTGREGEGGGLVTAGEAVTVQGRFDRGFIHAAFLVGPDAKVVALGPLGGPGRHGPRHGRDDGPDGPPPPRGAGPAGAGAPPPPPGAGLDGSTPPPPAATAAASSPGQTTPADARN